MIAVSYLVAHKIGGLEKIGGKTRVEAESLGDKFRSTPQDWSCKSISPEATMQ